MLHVINIPAGQIINYKTGSDDGAQAYRNIPTKCNTNRQNEF